MKKISVVVPAHNEEKCIRDVISAVLRQDYPDFEMIVVDNASKDHTYEYAKEFPITVAKEERKGTQWARECGRNLAKGEIIAYLDSDCIPDKDWLSKASKIFDDEKVVAVTGPYDYYDSSFSFRLISLWIQKYIYSVNNVILQFFKKGAVLIGGNMLIRASSLRDIGGLDTSIVFYGDDTDTAKRLSAVGQIYFEKNLIMKTSDRRFKGHGIFKTMMSYFITFYSTTFFGKSAVKNHKDFR